MSLKGAGDDGGTVESGTISSLAVPSVPSLVTEEGQRVSFDEETYICRELTKRLPLGEAFPDEPSSSPGLRDAALALLRRNGGGTQVPKRLLPAEIAPGVYVVGQERYDNLTYMIDCGREGIALIDPTYQSEVDRTIEHIERCGRRREEIRWILNTHCHTDHSMADRKFQEMGAEILIHADDAEHIERGTQVTAHRALEEDANAASLDAYPADFPTCTVSHRLVDGEELRLGEREFRIIHTPGHTPGSACFYLQSEGRNLLFSGDTVLYDFRAGWQDNPFADDVRYQTSLRKLARFSWDGTPVRWDVLLPGHGAMALDKADMDVSKVRSLVDADVQDGSRVEGWTWIRADYRQRMYGRPGC